MRSEKEIKAKIEDIRATALQWEREQNELEAKDISNPNITEYESMIDEAGREIALLEWVLNKEGVKP